MAVHSPLKVSQGASSLLQGVIQRDRRECLIVHLGSICQNPDLGHPPWILTTLLNIKSQSQKKTQDSLRRKIRKRREGKETAFSPLMHAKAGGNVIRFCNKPLSLCTHNFHAIFPDHEAGLCLPLFTIWSTGHLGHQAGFKMGRYRGRSGSYLFEYISQHGDWNNRRLRSSQMKCYFENRAVYTHQAC